MAKARKAVSRAVATRKARKSITLKINDEAREILAEWDRAEAAEAAWTASLRDGVLERKGASAAKVKAMQAALRKMRDDAWDAYNARVRATVERICGNPDGFGFRPFASPADIMTLVVIGIRGGRNAHCANVALLVEMLRLGGGKLRRAGWDVVLPREKAAA